MLPSSASGLGAGGEKGNQVSYFPHLSADGHHLAFESYSTNLTPDNLNGGYATYVRDLDTGALSPAIWGERASLSADGRYVAYDTGGAANNVYVSDLQTNTTTVASRANGANGAPANQSYGFMYPSISADGRYVAFQTTPPLDPVDTDTVPDIYVRDLEMNTTTLVSRASGAAGAKGDNWSERPSISGDGNWVAFETRASNLDPEDTNQLRDIYVRNISAASTAYASRSARFAGGGYNGAAYHPRISADGRYVTFDLRITSDSVDYPATVFEWNRQTDQSSTVGPGSTPAISSDGRFIAFQTDAQLSPDDIDYWNGQYWLWSDVYVRDMQTGTTTLASRGDGFSGADANNPADFAAISGDGRYVAFETGSDNLSPNDHDQQSDIYVRDLQTGVTSLESRASPGYHRYARPKGATPVRVALVPAAQECTSPNRTHGAPLSFGSCSPPGPDSPNLTIGVGDGSPALARSVGSIRMDVVAGGGVGGDQSDVNIRFRLSNVMRSADLSDYTGELQARTAVRITDKFNGPSSGEEATVQDFDLAVTVPCAATASTIDGGGCSVVTTADTVLPGFAPQFERAVYGLGQFRVYDGGPDEDADTTGDNSLFAVQGVFVP